MEYICLILKVACHYLHIFEKSWGVTLNRFPQGMSLPTKINQIGPCVQIPWPKNPSTLPNSTWDMTSEKWPQKQHYLQNQLFQSSGNVSKRLPYVIRLGRSLFISKHISLALILDFLVCKVHTLAALRSAYICHTQAWPDIISTSIHGFYRLV